MNAFECVTDAVCFFFFLNTLNEFRTALAKHWQISGIRNIPCTGLKTINFQQEAETTTVVEATVEVFVAVVVVVLCWFVYLFKFRISTTLK